MKFKSSWNSNISCSFFYFVRSSSSIFSKRKEQSQERWIFWLIFSLTHPFHIPFQAEKSKRELKSKKKNCFYVFHILIIIYCAVIFFSSLLLLVQLKQNSLGPLSFFFQIKNVVDDEMKICEKVFFSYLFHFSRKRRWNYYFFWNVKFWLAFVLCGYENFELWWKISWWMRFRKI